MVARQVVVQSTCDECGLDGPIETFRFGWDLVTYEIDLCQEHAAELSEVMERLISSGRRLGSPAKSVNVAPPAPSPRDMATTAEVRAWARKKGMDVSEKGRVPDEVFEKYLAAKGRRTRSS